MMRLTPNGFVPSFLAIIRQLCCSIWRTITYAQISKEVLGMVEGGVQPRTLRMQNKVSTNELLYTIMWIAPVIQQT